MIETKLDHKAFRNAVREHAERALGSQLDVLVLYGSRARGDAHEESDWDVLAMLHDNADVAMARRDLLEITGQLAERFGERVQFLAIRWADTHDAVGLIENAAREGVRL